MEEIHFPLFLPLDTGNAWCCTETKWEDAERGEEQTKTPSKAHFLQLNDKEGAAQWDRKCFSNFLLGKHHRKTVTHGHTHQPRAIGAHTWPSTGCHGAAHTAITGEMPDTQNQAPPPAHAAGSGLFPQPSLLQLSTAVRGGQVGGRDEGYPDISLHLVERIPPTPHFSSQSCIRQSQLKLV